MRPEETTVIALVLGGLALARVGLSLGRTLRAMDQRIELAERDLARLRARHESDLAVTDERIDDLLYEFDRATPRFDPAGRLFTEGHDDHLRN